MDEREKYLMDQFSAIETSEEVHCMKWKSRFCARISFAIEMTLTNVCASSGPHHIWINVFPAKDTHESLVQTKAPSIQSSITHRMCVQTQKKYAKCHCRRSFSSSSRLVSQSHSSPNFSLSPVLKMKMHSRCFASAAGRPFNSLPYP